MLGGEVSEATSEGVGWMLGGEVSEATSEGVG